MPDVLIRGEGVAAYACAHLLGEAGFRVVQERTARTRLPAILLNESTQALLGDVFGRRDLFEGLPRIDRRVVAWGPSAKANVLPHSAVVVSEAELSERVRTNLPGEERRKNAEPDWTVLSSRPLPAPSVEHHFGSRRAAAVAVKLIDPSDATACWIESLEGGWLFLLPGAAQGGYLLAVGDKPELLLAESRLIAPRIELAAGAASEFPAYPRIAHPLCGPGWLACGTAALAFDPLCGDGTGHAIREGILAAAVIRAAANETEVEPLLQHYQGRLSIGLLRHLKLCREFYCTGHAGPWWAQELNLLDQGIQWCDRELGGAPRFRYRLSGFELQPIP